jgi:hypothetical protein
MLVDTYQRQKQHEYEQIVEICHLHGVPLSKNLLERGRMWMNWNGKALVTRRLTASLLNTVNKNHQYTSSKASFVFLII